MKLNVKVSKCNVDATLPKYGKVGDAGMDLSACITSQVEILPGKRFLVPTGIIIAVPEGYEAQVRSRSGLAAKSGICVTNAPGTIDSGYRGEVKVSLENRGESAFVVNPGDRVAQLVIAPVIEAVWDEVSLDDIGETDRGAGGFGSTGIVG